MPISSTKTTTATTAGAMYHVHLTCENVHLYLVIPELADIVI